MKKAKIICSLCIAVLFMGCLSRNAKNTSADAPETTGPVNKIDSIVVSPLLRNMIDSLCNYYKDWGDTLFLNVRCYHEGDEVHVMTAVDIRPPLITESVSSEGYYCFEKIYYLFFDWTKEIKLNRYVNMADLPAKFSALDELVTT